MFAKSVDKKQVDKLVNSGALLVDMRSPVAFRNGSIDQSVNLPYRNFVNQLSGMNPKQHIVLIGETDKDSDLVSSVNYAVGQGFTVYVTDYKRLVQK